MKRFKWLFLVFAVVIFAAAGWVLGRISSRNLQAMPVQAQGIGSVDTKLLQDRLNFTFVPVDPAATANQVSVSEKDAIAVAESEQEGRLKAATSVTAELGYLTDTGLEAAASDPGLQTDIQKGPVQVDTRLLGKQLVWVISFEGIDTVSNGPAESKHGVAHEFNSVIDANTGEFIIGFTYR